MLEEGERAPAFTAPMATPEAAADSESGEYTAEEVSTFELSAALADGPVVLAFFPGVFSRTCTREMCEFRDWLPEVGGLDAQVYGVSVDPPWPQLAFIERYGLGFPLVSGFNNDLIDRFGVRHGEGSLAGIAQRSVFVLAPDRTVEYAWGATEPLTFPDLDAVEGAVVAAGAD
jgi:peroxiredoxin